MFVKTYNLLIILYVLIVFVLITMKKISKYNFLLWGVIGQILLFNMSIHIYRSKHIWTSFNMYALMYVLYIFSFTCIDIFFFLDNPHHFKGTIHHENNLKMFIDFFYVNISTISTIGYGDITASSTETRLYFSYKIAIAIFMIVFLVSDIVVKTK